MTRIADGCWVSGVASDGVGTWWYLAWHFFFVLCAVASTPRITGMDVPQIAGSPETDPIGAQDSPSRALLRVSSCAVNQAIR